MEIVYGTGSKPYTLKNLSAMGKFGYINKSLIRAFIYVLIFSSLYIARAVFTKIGVQSLYLVIGTVGVALLYFIYYIVSEGYLKDAIFKYIGMMIVGFLLTLIPVIGWIIGGIFILLVVVGIFKKLISIIKLIPLLIFSTLLYTCLFYPVLFEFAKIDMSSITNMSLVEVISTKSDFFSNISAYATEYPTILMDAAYVLFSVIISFVLGFKYGLKAGLFRLSFITIVSIVILLIILSIVLTIFRMTDGGGDREESSWMDSGDMQSADVVDGDYCVETTTTTHSSADGSITITETTRFW